MRERDRTLSHKKKLLRTTTFGALLIVALMVLGSATPAINVNMKSTQLNDNNITEPQGRSDDTASVGAQASEPNLGSAVLEKEWNYQPTHRGAVIFDNGMGFSSLASAQYDTMYGIDSMPADDFYFDTGGVETCVYDVHWIGGHWNGAWDYETGCSWKITFWYDADGAKYVGSKPGAQFKQYTVTWAAMSKTLIYDYGTTSYWEFGANIPETCFPGCGEVYWITIQGVQDIFPQIGWGFHYYFQGHIAMFKCDYFGYPDWSDNPWGQVDMAFQLTAKTTHDVAVTKITKPVAEDLCDGCVPVEVKVKNLGLVDETTPVHVKIYQTLAYYDEFYFDWTYNTASWWEAYYVTEGVTPHSMYYMYEFKANAGTYYATCYDSFDFSEACNPVVGFWMWHDNLGSNDYIQVTANGVALDGKFYRNGPTGWAYHEVAIPKTTTSIGFVGVADSIYAAYPIFIDDVYVLDVPYDVTQTVDLAVGEEKTVAFPDFCLCQWGEMENVYLSYFVDACTELTTDENKANDCMTVGPIEFYIPYYHDVGVLSKSEEPTGDCLDYSISGTIKNFGQYQECCFKVYADVYEGYYTDWYQIYNEQFNSPMYGLPAGWSTNTPDWQIYWYYYFPGHAYGDNSLDFLYWYQYGSVITGRVQSGPINTAGMGSVRIRYDSYLSDYNSQYDLYVETSSNGVDWTVVYEPTIATGTYLDETIETSVNVGGTFYLAFTFVGDPWNTNYWDIDNLRIDSREFVRTAHVFSEWYCIDTIDPCATQTIDFGVFHAPIDPGCGAKDYQVCIKTALCDPMDENPTNDELCNILNVPYSVDVDLAITTPEPKADIILFEQACPGAYEWGNAYTSDTGAGYLMQEDFEGLTDGPIGTVIAYGLPLICCWSPGNPAELVFDVMFYDYNGGSSPGAQVSMADNVVPTSYTFLWSYYGVYECYAFRLDLPASVALTQGWLGVQTNGATTWFLWIDSLYGDNNAYQSGASVFDNVAFTLIKGGLSFTPEVWVGEGEQDFCATVKNIGTFDLVDDPATPCDIEGVVVSYNISVYVPPECPDCEGYVEEILTGSETIDLACGEEADVCFTYDFTECGIYIVYFWADTVPADCDYSNNVDGIVVGIDNCPPVAALVTDPAAPDGCNNWFKKDVKVTITAEDSACDCECMMSELKEIHYKLNGGSDVVKTKSPVTFTISTEGINFVEYWAVDNAGNQGIHHTQQIAIDKTKPEVSMLYEKITDGTLQIKFTAAAFDKSSGISKVEFYIDDELKETQTGPKFEWIVTWDASYKTKTFKAKAYDGACWDNIAEIFGGDIDTVRANFNALAQNQPLTQALSQQI